MKRLVRLCAVVLAAVMAGSLADPALAIPPEPDYTVALTETSGTTDQGGVASTTFTSTVITGGTSIALSASGVPEGVTVTFAPEYTYSGGGSAVAITTSRSTPPGTYPIGIDARAGKSHSVTYTLTVVPADPANDFTVALSDPAPTVDRGTSGTVTLTSAAGGAAPQSVALSAVVAHQGIGVSIAPATITSGESGVITLSPANLPFGSYNVIVYASGAVRRAAALRLTVRDGRPDDFSVRLLPAAATVDAGQGSSTTALLQTTQGRRQRVTFSSSGAPEGVTVTGWPSPADSDAYVAVRVVVGQKVPGGTYPITLAFTGSVTHTATYTLTVRPRVIPAWKPNYVYFIGDLAGYDGVVYRCTYQHTSMPGWEPPRMPSLWTVW
ncbi:hypothetical protein Ssi03_02700 [Sphaerisporangium siamense]|uniref:Chitin-binding type-3 domain-containing protein n=1 Tax=Sphaerisporangium siamense TaxID=795645 RepID=A0A7W7GE92_9ACTN|nr:carbohydrate-binding protein [Sphaerisporangium siamense]MBB4703811.1 hypothetical protein [Sphaerisporangium siamense]GII82280.1 hypothetical protein Ssi03_02700 [Sphaerisporangium siamense]